MLTKPNEATTLASEQEMIRTWGVDAKHRAHLAVWGGHVINGLDHYHVHERGETRGGINLPMEASPSQFEVYGMR